MSRNSNEPDHRAIDDEDNLPEVGADRDLELEEEDEGAERRLDPLRRPA
jgi:hypothetical protein